MSRKYIFFSIQQDEIAPHRSTSRFSGVYLNCGKALGVYDRSIAFSIQLRIQVLQVWGNTHQIYQWSAKQCNSSNWYSYFLSSDWKLVKGVSRISLLLIDNFFFHFHITRQSNKIGNLNNLLYLNYRLPSSWQITLSSSNRFSTTATTVNYSEQPIFPPNIYPSGK